MELTTAGSRKKWDFQIITKNHEEIFVQSVLDDYQYSVGEQFEMIPDDDPFCVQTFIHRFQDSYMTLETVVEEDLYPQLDWEKLSDDEQSDIHEEVSDEAGRYFNAYATDVVKVLDFHQLFYVSEVFKFIEETFENPNRYRNSPLQEVW